MHLYEAIRGEILEGRLVAGAPLSQLALANRFSVSRAPIREALRLLQTERLVDAAHNRRMRVATFSPEDFEQLYTLRLLAEPTAVRLTVPLLVSDDLALLESAHGQLTPPKGKIAPPPFGPHRRFHALLCSGAGTRLRRHISDLWDYSERYMRKLPPDPLILHLGMEDHGALLAAARRHDADECGRRTALHVARAGVGRLREFYPEYEAAALSAAIRRTLEVSVDEVLQAS